MPSRAIGRRGAAATVLAALAWPARAEEKLEDTLVVRTTSGPFEAALKRNFFDPFTAATGTRVVTVPASYGEMISKTAAMSAAGRVEWDIISPQFYELRRLAPFLTDLGGCDALPNVARHGTPGICERYGMQFLTAGVVLGWSTDAFKSRPPPTTWADFWEVKRFPGGRALPSYGNPWNNTLLFALMADGVAPDALFPLDLDRAFRKLDEIKPHIDVWWKTGVQSTDIIRSGEVAMTPLWSGSAYAAKRAGLGLDWTYNQAAADLGSLAILKGCPHPKAAMAFLDYFIAFPEHHAGFMREMGYATTNRTGLSLLGATERHELVSTPEMAAGLAHIDGDWVEANRVATLDRWNKWLAA